MNKFWDDFIGLGYILDMNFWYFMGKGKWKWDVVFNKEIYWDLVCLLIV